MLVIIGAGGHASDVADLALRCGVAPVGALDDRAPQVDRLRGRSVPIFGKLEDLPSGATYTLGIGYPRARRAAAGQLPDGSAHAALIDPSAVVSPTADIGLGVQVFWLAGVSPLVRLGRHVLVSYGATVGHDTTIDEFSSVLPGARISGEVAVGAAVLIGSGAVVLQGITIGDEATVGAGAVVTRNVPAGATVTGIPAR